MADDYYKILGIEKSASDEDVKKAYRKLAHQYHPDRPSGDEKKFKKLNEAYQILSSKEKRSQYDQYCRVFEGGSGGAGGFDFGGFSSGGGPASGWEFGFDPHSFSTEGEGLGDIFDAFFEGMGVRKKKKTYKRGSDVELVQEITLEDSFSGITKKVALPIAIQCETCGGKGHDEAAGFSNCSVCDGQGEIRETRNTFFGNFSQVRTCEKCWGTGQIPKKICKDCSGTGRKKGERSIGFEIVQGISDGQIIKIVGAGEAGERGAAAGDLYVRIKIKPHSVFERQGDDLFIKKEVGFFDVLLNKPIEIKTIGGEKLNVEIPAGFNLREKLRMAGQGMPKFGAGILQSKRGDLYIIFNVKTPGKLSVKAKKILEDLGREL